MPNIKTFPVNKLQLKYGGLSITFCRHVYILTSFTEFRGHYNNSENISVIRLHFPVP